MIADAKPNILVLDDDESFAEITANYLRARIKNSSNIHYFSNSKEYIDYALSNFYLPDSPQEILSSFYSYPITKESTEQTLKDLTYLPALLVLDYQLQNDNKTGLEVAKSIKNFVPCPFIALLTAKVEFPDAITFHNDGVIDLFVPKNGIDSLKYLCEHLDKKISTAKSQYLFDPEDLFHFDSILDSEIYIEKKKELLNEVDYRSYVTISKNADLAILNNDNKVLIFKYHNEAFWFNE